MLFKIKNALRNWADKSSFGSLVFQICRNFVATTMMILPDKLYAKWFYKLYTKKKLNLKNPKYFDEKIWWLKLNNRDPLLTKCSDKFAVREYVKEAGYEDILVDLIGVYEKPKDILFDEIKEEAIIKCTSGSGENVFYNPVNHPNRKMIIRRMKY